MKLPRYSRRLVSLLLIAGVVAQWGFEGSPTEELGRSEAANSEIDSYLIGARIRQFDRAGNLDRSLEARRIDQLSTTATYLIQQPRIQLQSRSGSVLLTAQQGEADQHDQLVQLYGDVNIVRAGQPELRLTTERINLRPRLQLAWTGAEVQIQRGGMITHATGLNAYLDQSRIELLDNVRGRYATP